MSEMKKWKGITPDGKTIIGDEVRWKGLSCWIVIKTKAGCQMTKVLPNSVEEIEKKERYLNEV